MFGVPIPPPPGKFTHIRTDEPATVRRPSITWLAGEFRSLIHKSGVKLSNRLEKLEESVDQLLRNVRDTECEPSSSSVKDIQECMATSLSQNCTRQSDFDPDAEPVVPLDQSLCLSDLIPPSTGTMRPVSVYTASLVFTLQAEDVDYHHRQPSEVLVSYADILDELRAQKRQLDDELEVRHML